MIASVAFRAPILVNAAGTNSDAAVVGLQAMHLLRGEGSPFLWGSGYQTSVDSAIAALWFLVAGPSALALTASTLAGHVLLTWLCFDMLRTALTVGSGSATRPGWTAAALVLPLVFTPDPVHTYVLYPPRQASLTLVYLAFWLCQGAAASRRPLPRFAAAGAVAWLAVYADPYALLFLPAHALFALLAALDGKALPSRLGAWAGGAAVGLVPYVALRHHPLATPGQTSLSLGVVRHNFELLVDTCAPWLLSTRVYAAVHMTDYQPWDPGAPFHAVQLLGAAALLLGVASAVPLARDRRLAWEVRRLGLVGAFMVPVTIGGFLVSPMVMDHFSSRYLAAILLVSPLCLAPLAARVGRARVLALLAPYLVSAAVSGWVSFRPFGLSVHPNLALDERLGAALRERDVRYAVADYWASYRLTFLWRENPTVVPTNEVEDRYRPYRDAFDAARVVAYIHDAHRSREALDGVEAKIQLGETPFEPRYERFTVGTFTVLVLRRREGSEGVASLFGEREILAPIGERVRSSW